MPLTTLAAFTAAFLVAAPVHAATIDASAPVAALDLAASNEPPQIAYATLADRYLVVWTTVERGPVRGAILDSVGKVVVPTFDVAPEGSCPSVASNGRDFVIARRNEALFGGDGPLARVVHATGSVDAELMLSGGPKGPNGTNACPHVAWDGAAYRIAWAHLDGSPLGLATYAPPATPNVETGFVVPTSVRGLACAGETCLVSSSSIHADTAPQSIAIWNRGAKPQPRVNVDRFASTPIFRNGAFDFVRDRHVGDTSVTEAAEIATLDLLDPRFAQGTGNTTLALSFSRTIPLSSAWFPSHALADWGSLFAWEKHDGTVPTHATVLLSTDVTGTATVAVMPTSDDSTYRAVSLQAGPRGRALVTATRGNNADPPFSLLVRAVAIEGLPDAPGNTDGGAGASNGNGGAAENSPPEENAPPTSSTNASGCGCRMTASASSSLGTVAIAAAALALVIRRRRMSKQERR